MIERTRFLIWSRPLALGLASGLVACSDTSDGPADPGPPEPDPAAVATVVLTPDTAQAEEGTAIQFEAVALDSAGVVLEDRAIGWTSSDPSVATVDSTGLALALARGLTTVTASSEGIDGSAALTVVPAAVATVFLTPDTAQADEGTTVQFEAVTLDSAGVALEGRSITWASSDPSVATIDSAGLALGLAPGLTTVTATSEGIDGSAALTVVHAPVTLVGAGDIADCETPWDEATADLLDEIDGTVFTAGDNVYEDGTAQEYADCYGPSWGRHKERTYPAIGNHEYHASNGAPHFAYFGSRAGDPDKGYYSYEAGAWKVIVLNSNPGRVPVEAGSEQVQWLRDELSTSDHACTLAYWHHPRFSSGVYGDDERFDAFWQSLYEFGAELVVVGHEHHYERLAPLNPAGEIDEAAGIRQIIAGTGGRYLRPTGVPRIGSEVRDSDTHGVLKLTLRHDTYDWEFVPVAGQAFTDSGSGQCH